MYRSAPTNNRGTGIVLILIGLVAGYMYVYLPYRDMLSGAESVHTVSNGVMLVPIAIGLGLMSLFGGSRLNTVEKPQAYAVGLFLAALGFGLHHWLMNQFDAHGYSEPSPVPIRSYIVKRAEQP